MRSNADEIVRRAWRELPRKDRDLLEAISAGQWQVCDRRLGTYTDELLRSAGRGSLPEGEIARANDALALWVPDLRVMLINENHPAFDGLDEPTLIYDLSRVAWHEWGHALSLDRAGEEDVAAGERYVELLPEGLAKLVRQAGYRRREYTHEGSVTKPVKLPAGYRLPKGTTMADVRRLDRELLASEGLEVRDHKGKGQKRPFREEK